MCNQAVLPSLFLSTQNLFIYEGSGCRHKLPSHLLSLCMSAILFTYCLTTTTENLHRQNLTARVAKVLYAHPGELYFYPTFHTSHVHFSLAPTVSTV